VALVLVAAGAWAQDWRGTGRLMGNVVDDKGKPLEGVIVRASFPAVVNAILESTSDKRGQWTVDDVGEGDWELTFEKDGYNSAKASASVDESGRSAPIKITLKKKFDPNEFIQEEGKKAAALIDQKKFAEARAIYESIVAKVPEVSGQMQPFIARTYQAEGDRAKAIEHFKIGVEKDPANVQTKMELINVLLEDGNTEEAQQQMSRIDEAKIDPVIYVNFGVAVMKKQQNAADAIKYFDKALAKAPQMPEPYYYRAHANITLVNAAAEKDPKNPERIERLGKIKSDLEKYLQLAPSAPLAEDVKKLLEQVEKMLQSK
jgi:tetratricopeptide (TPR) repeat protein